MIKVLTFGTFDGIHEGHRDFFRQARLHGDQLIVAVAQDDVVALLKDHLPERDMDQRMEDLSREDLIDMVIAGDVELGSYAVVRRHRPDVIVLGYDQEPLKWDLEASLDNRTWEMDVVMVKPYQPETYHSSIIAKKKK